MNVKEYIAAEVKMEQVKVDDLIINVKTWIPYSTMEAMAIELAEHTILFDEENGFACVGYALDMMKVYLMLKYFTDFPIEGLTPEEVYDFVRRAGIGWEIEKYFDPQMFEIMMMHSTICENLKTKYEKEHSIGALLKKTFGFLLNGEDISESLAKSSEIANRMVEVMDVFQEHSKDAKKNSPKMKVGGVALNLAKK